MALQLIKKSDNLIVYQISSSLIKSNIANFWNNMDNNQKTEYMYTLMDIIYASAQFNDIFLDNLIYSICQIALFEWPDNFKDFSKIFSQQEDENKLKISIKILSSFVKEINDSKNISDLHRNNLRQYILNHYKENIVLIIKNYFFIQELTKDVLNFFYGVFDWFPQNDIIDSDFFQSLVNHFHNMIDDQSFEIFFDILNYYFFESTFVIDDLYFECYLILFDELSNEIMQTQLNFLSNKFSFSFLNNPDQFNQDIIEKSLNVVSKCCATSRSSAKDLFNLIWPSLSQLVNFFLPNANQQVLSNEILLVSIANVQANMKFEEVFPHIENIFNLMTARGRIEDCFFRYFSMIKQKFDEIDQMYPIIHEKIVIPFLLNGEPPSFDMFKMIDVFSANNFDIEWLSSIVIQTIKQMSSDVVNICLDVYKKKLKNYTIDNLAIFVN